MTRKGRARKRPSAPPPFNGDHGTQTDAAKAGTVVEPMTNDKGENPNHMGRRRRVEVFETLKFLSMRQIQAAREIRDAYCAVESTTSGGPLQDKIDASPKPDAVIAAQVSTRSRLERAMHAVPSHMRLTVEEVCWHNTPLTKTTLGYEIARSDMSGALSLVADHLGY